ncbi:hypothetical protein WH50_08445 [Pokkaliibacter plantistimulans]|uniref:Cell division protein FtsQ n=1 Tax=Pokkaliibacter plantistimulans TaxID=1635171 RepID=A0ABX5M2F3_9GAMM|nr:hypothetical protein WH50_08445 [Pokkaliibacter plantistimulans]
MSTRGFEFQVRSSERPRGATRLTPRVQKPKVRLPWKKWFGWLFNLMALIVLVVGAICGGQALWPWLNRPVTEISVQGNMHYVDGQALHALLQEEVKGAFFDLDLNSIQKMVEANPWVERVDIHRIWPDRLVVNVDEELPVARWGDKQLVNSVGRIFTPQQAQLDELAGLPRLYGPDDQVQEAMRYFSTLSQQLRPLQMKISDLILEKRGAWTVDVIVADQPLRILLGREDLRERLYRFSTIYTAALKDRISQIEQIDVRHTNGVAVRWKQPAST